MSPRRAGQRRRQVPPGAGALTKARQSAGYPLLARFASEKPPRHASHGPLPLAGGALTKLRKSAGLSGHSGSSARAPGRTHVNPTTTPLRGAVPIPLQGAFGRQSRPQTPPKAAIRGGSVQHSGFFRNVPKYSGKEHFYERILKFGTRYAERGILKFTVGERRETPPPFLGGALTKIRKSTDYPSLARFASLETPSPSADADGPSPPFRGRPDETSKECGGFDRVLFAAWDAGSPPAGRL